MTNKSGRRTSKKNYKLSQYNKLKQDLKKSFEEIKKIEKGNIKPVNVENEWESIQETLRLLKDKRSLKALLESHKTRDENQEIAAKTVKEAFYDL